MTGIQASAGPVQFHAAGVGGRQLRVETIATLNDHSLPGHTIDTKTHQITATQLLAMIRTADR